MKNVMLIGLILILCHAAKAQNTQQQQQQQQQQIRSYRNNVLPYASLYGRILDAQKQPLLNTKVYLVKRPGGAGADSLFVKNLETKFNSCDSLAMYRLQSTKFSLTDDKGFFNFYGVAKGARYALVVCGHKKVIKITLSKSSKNYMTVPDQVVN